MSPPSIGPLPSALRLADAAASALHRTDTDPVPEHDTDAKAPAPSDDPFGSVAEALAGITGFGGGDAPTPGEALEQIDALPEPDSSDIPHNLPPEDRAAIRDARDAAYQRKTAAIADDALAHAQPPTPGDYADLPPALRHTAYQEDLQAYQTQLSQLQTRSLKAKQANLRHDPDFGQLPPDVQAQALGAMDANRARPADVDLIAEVAGSQAFRDLGVSDLDLPLIGPLHFDGAARKSQLLTLIGADTPLSASARGALREAIHGDGPNDPDDNQVQVSLDDAKSLDRFVWTGARPADLWRDALPASGIPDDARRPVSVSGPEAIDHDFPSSTTPDTNESGAALRYTVRVDGKDIEVILPAEDSRDPTKSYPTIEQIAQGVAGMPPELVSATDRIIAVPLAKAEKNDQGEIVPSGADMYAGGGEITINPHDASAPRAQKDFDTTFLHEGAHLLAQPDKAEWNRAVAADHLFSTHYADNNYAPNANVDPGSLDNPAEDFAEAYMIYKLVQGTPDEAQMRALMPERFALLDTLYP